MHPMTISVTINRHHKTMKRAISKATAVGILTITVVAAYCISWWLLRPAGLVHPMANLRYYHFGAEPDSRTDVILYYFYLPAYRVFGKSAYGIHHSERRDAVTPSLDVNFTDTAN